MQKYEHNILKNIDLSIFIKNFFRLFFGLSNLTFVSISKSVLSGSFTAESLNEGWIRVFSRTPKRTMRV